MKSQKAFQLVYTSIFNRNNRVYSDNNRERAVKGPLGKKRRLYAGFVVSFLSHISEDSQFPITDIRLLRSVHSQNSYWLISFLRSGSP